MKCSQREELHAYIDQELNERKREIVEEHLRACDECKRYTEEINEVKKLISSLPEEKARVECFEKTFVQIKERSNNRFSLEGLLRFFKSLSMSPAIYACLLFIIIGFTFLITAPVDNSSFASAQNSKIVEIPGKKYTLKYQLAFDITDKEE